MMTLFDFLDKSLTAYHAVENATAILKENGFEELKENENFAPVKGGKYFVRRNGSALIAFPRAKKTRSTSSRLTPTALVSKLKPRPR